MNPPQASFSLPNLLRTGLVLVVGLLAGCPDSAPPSALPPTQGTGKESSSKEIGRSARKVDQAKVGPEVEAFCGGCHAVPRPSSFPQKAWAEEVNRGFNIFLGSGRGDLLMPRVADAVEYFRSQAPEKLEFAPDPIPDHDTPFLFRTEPWIRTDPREVPGIAFLALHRLPDSASPRLFSCDMSSGEILVSPADGSEGLVPLLARLEQPCHIEPVDFNNDGRREYVVASLGSYQPGDHDNGKVWLIQPDFAGGSQPAPKLLQKGLGRVADVRPVDVDHDGDIDLVVAEFGFIKTGRILLLRNLGSGNGQASGDNVEPATPHFELEVLDPRHGTIHVPICDLNNDGHPDFVACISQDHETIVAFLNDGKGSFEPQTLFSADDPAWGSNGIQVIDLDGDGDLDVLASNGDTLDSKFLKPYHGIQWLENKGTFPFTSHRIAQLPGVSRVLAGDFDLDGDLDLFATAFFPANLRKLPEAPKLQSAVLFENTGGMQFSRFPVETGNLEHMCLETGDVDNDGDVDVLIGHCASNPTDSPQGKPHISLWRNLKIDNPAPR